MRRSRTRAGLALGHPHGVAAPKRLGKAAPSD
jgi:hypothetical protein